MIGGNETQQAPDSYSDPVLLKNSRDIQEMGGARVDDAGNSSVNMLEFACLLSFWC